MSTGYTAGIESGDIKTFKDYATICMKAFGATIHMRDDSLDAPYVERKPDTYHQEKIKAISKEIISIKKKTEASIEKTIVARAKKDIKYAKERIEVRTALRETLTKFLEQSNAFVPPTHGHVRFKEFLIEQLNMTIVHDTDSKYADDLLLDAQNRLKDIRKLVKSYKSDEIKALKKEIVYHTTKQKEEIKRCKESNKWVADLLKVLNK